VIRDNEKGTDLLIDAAISGDRNVIKKDADHALKCEGLPTEIRRMWKCKAKVIPVIRGATGTISSSFRKYLSNVPGKSDIKEPHKTDTCSSANTLRKVLMYKYFITDNSITCTETRNHKFYTPERACFGYVIVHTLYEGVNK
jgi:hypothetical protein